MDSLNTNHTKFNTYNQSTRNICVPSLGHGGFTLVELIIAIAIMGTLAALTSVIYSSYRERAKVNQAISDIKVIQDEITLYESVNDKLPDDLSVIDKHTLLDPWGNPYVYSNFSLVSKGKWRKDKFLVPINSTYDLCSLGPDGQTQAPLTAKASYDDIIRANDGSFIGRAANY